jgi:D-glycero-D-manno-heptose 1,7-bisphosphate phosphatase
MSKAVFLDRDGVVNRSIIRDGKPYAPRTREEFILDENLGELARLKALGFRLIIVTNQPDVGNGLVTAKFLDSLHAVLYAAFPFDDILACHHRSQDGCGCRKPKPGMLLAAQQKFGIDMKHSYMVGDRWRDVVAGEAAGCATVFLDYGYQEEGPEFRPHFTCASLLEAIEWIEHETVQSSSHAVPQP